jgi:hypothetical protein
MKDLQSGFLSMLLLPYIFRYWRPMHSEDLGPIHLAGRWLQLKFREKLIDLICSPGGKIVMCFHETLKLCT